MKHENLLLDLRDEIVSTFEGNLVGLLQYGSSLFEDSCINTVDLDLLIILKNKDVIENDLKFLETLNARYSELNLDIQLQYAEEIFSSNHFSLDAHGSYFTEILKLARVLYGTNPFLELDYPSNDGVSILHQIQNYVFRARQIAMGMAKSHKDTNTKYHIKKIKNIMNDLLFLEYHGIEREVEKTINAFQKYFRYFTEEEIKKLLELKPNAVYDYIPYYEKLYNLGLKIVKDKTMNLPKINRFRVGNIISEICVAPAETRKCVVLLEGLPSVPYRKKLMQRLSLEGFNVVFPRY